MKSGADKRRIFLCVYAAFALNGMLALSVGSLLPFIRDGRGLNYAQAGVLVSLHSVGNLFSSFFSGILAGKVGRKRSILLFNLFFPLSYVLILAGHSFPLLAAAFLMTGIARGATSNFSNTAINALAPGKAAALNGLHAMFSIGAFLLPILLAAITADAPDHWIWGCLMMIVLGLVSVLLYALCPQTAGEAGTGGNDGGSRADAHALGFFRDRIFYVATATLFFYLCAEAGVIGWMVTWFTDTGYISAGLSQLMASVLWIMMLAGRLLTAFLAGRVDKGRLLSVMGAGIVVFFVLMLFVRSTVPIVLAVMGFGFFMAGIYPTTVSLAGGLINRYPLAWSFILTIASLGAVIMPVIIGGIAESAGIGPGISSIAAAVVIDFICILVLRQTESKRKAA